MKLIINLFMGLWAFYKKLCGNEIPEPAFACNVDEGLIYVSFTYTESSDDRLYDLLRRLGYCPRKDADYIYFDKDFLEKTVTATIRVAIMKGESRNTLEVLVDSQKRKFKALKGNTDSFFIFETITKCLQEHELSFVVVLPEPEFSVVDATIYEIKENPVRAFDAECDTKVVWMSDFGLAFLVKKED